MKNMIYFLFLLGNINLNAQSFLPFQSNSRKLYRDDSGNTYSLTFQLATTSQVDSVFTPTLNVDGNMFYSDSCIFWGGNVCHQQNLPGWLGKKVKTNNIGKYTFYQVNGDSLSFVFNADANDTNLIFQNNTEILRMSFANTTSVQILGFTDSINYYNLYHTDINGNPINSVLSQFQLAVGKQLGLINFLKIDSFPNEIITLSLLGNQQPNLGIFAITDELVYDYNIGDEYQWHDYSSVSLGGWPPNIYNAMVKYTILDKTITSDSIFYSFLLNTINLSTNVQITDTVDFNIQKNKVICEIPIEIFDGSNYKQFKQIELCGNNYWELTLMNEPYNLAFCALDTCWGGIDTQGPAASITKKIILGLGQTNLQDILTGGGFNQSHYITSELVYFKKNGQICGTEQIVGNKETSDNLHRLTIAPNPAKQSVRISYTVTEASAFVNISVYNLQGQLVIEKVVPNKINITSSTLIDVNELNNGFYFINLEVNGRILQSAKFIKN